MNAGIKKIFPVFEWLPAYQKTNLRWDLIAGITLAFFVIPESMAYASLAGLPPQTGIYCYLFGGLLYLIFGSSRQLAIGPTSAISIVIGTSIGVMSAGDPAKAVIVASAIALTMALLFFIAYIIKLSSLVNFISDTILVGFKSGAALVILSTQLPKLFGIERSGSNFFERIWYLITHIGETNPAVFIYGVLALILLVLGNHFFHGKPVSLIIVILSIILVTFTDLKDLGITLVGDIPRGIPALKFPATDFSEMSEVFFLALACFFLSYVESISAARALARKNKYEIDPRQELLALGFANLGSSVGGGYAVAGGLSQSTVNDRSGAKTLVSLLIASVVLCLSLLFLTGLLKNMPEVILAVIVLDAVSGLIRIKEIKHLYKVNRIEFWVSVLTIVAVILFGVLQGIVIAALLSIITILRKNSTPHIAILGRIPGTNLYSDMLRHQDNEPVKGTLILRPESSILYFNCNYIHDTIQKMVNEHREELRLVIIDLSSANYVDVAGARLMLQIEDELEKQDIRLRIVEALGTVRDILRAEGMENEIGHISRKVSINDILSEMNTK